MTEKPRSQRRLSIVYGLPSCQSFVYMLSMASALEKTKKTRCRVFVEVATTSTPRFLQLPARFSNFYCVSFDMTITVIRKIPDRSLDANTRDITPVKTTVSTIL